MTAAGRRTRVAAILSERGAGLLVADSPAAIAYLTDVDVRGFSAAATVVLGADSDVVLIVSEPDAPSVAAEGVTVSRWRPGPDAAAERSARVRGAVEAAARGARRGFAETRGESGAGLVASLSRLLPGAVWNAGDDVLDAAWRTRDEEEIGRLREAANLADIGYTAIVDRLTPDLRVLEIVRNVDRSLRSAGGGGFWSPHEDDAGITDDILYPRADIAVLLGRRPETGVLDRSAPLPFALYPLSQGYAGAAGTTAILSAPSATLRSRAELLADAVYAAIAAIRPGAVAGEVHAEFSSVLRSSLGEEDPAAAQTIGYGIGTGIARPFLVPGSADEITPRTAVSVRASLSTEDGRPPIAYQTTVLVTETGTEVLNTVPLRLIELY